MRAALVVLNWNTWKETAECLESLQQLTYPEYQIVVVDNGSTDDSLERIRAWARGELTVESHFFSKRGPKPVQVVEYGQRQAEWGGDEAEERAWQSVPSSQRLVLIRNRSNLGFAAGCNVGFRYALQKGFRYIGALNSDAVAAPDCLTRLIKTLESRKEWAAVSPRILFKDDPSRIYYAGGWVNLALLHGKYLGHQQKDTAAWRGVRETRFVSGACFVACRELFEKVGLFDEDFFFGFEEVAHSLAARRRGFQVGVDLDAVIYHREGASYGRKEAFRTYHVAKGRLLLLRKYGAKLEKISGAVCFALNIFAKAGKCAALGRIGLIRAAWEGVRDFFKGRFGDYDRGLQEAPAQAQCPSVTICIVNFNRKEDTAACLDSIAGLDYPRYEVLVIDNGSSDGSVEFLRRNYPWAEVLENHENVGFGEAQNRGIRRALERGADYVLILNNDTVISPSLLHDLLEVMAKDPSIGIAGPKILYYDRKDRIWFAGGRLYLPWGNTRHRGMHRRDSKRYERVVDEDYQTGCALLVKREVIEKTGLFDPVYFAYWEDVDLCLRAKRLGYRVVCVQQAKIWHKVSRTTGGGLNPEKAYFKARAGMKFFYRYAPRTLYVTTVPLGALGYILWTSLGEWFRGKRGVFRAYLSGVVDGYKDHLTSSNVSQSSNMSV